MSSNYVYDLQNDVIITSLGNKHKCTEMDVNLDDQQSGSKKWYLCDSFNNNNISVSLSQTYNGNPFGKVPYFDVSIVEQYLNDKQDERICGFPEVGFGNQIIPIVEYHSYAVSCRDDFSPWDEHTTDTLICDDNRKWNKTSVQCKPNKFCPLIEENVSSVEKIISIENVYWRNTTRYWIIEGTQYTLICKGDSTPKVIICGNDRKYNGSCEDNIGIF